jgi:hypothetical protein
MKDRIMPVSFWWLIAALPGCLLAAGVVLVLKGF